MHADYPGQESVELPQTLDEPRDGDDLAAVFVEVLLGVVEALRRQEDVAAETLDERAAAEVSGGEADVVADDCAENSDQDHQCDVHVARTREDRRGDQNRLAGHRHAEVFEKHESADRQVAVVFEHGLQIPEHTG